MNIFLNLLIFIKFLKSKLDTPFTKFWSQKGKVDLLNYEVKKEKLRKKGKKKIQYVNT